MYTGAPDRQFRWTFDATILKQPRLLQLILTGTIGCPSNGDFPLLLSVIDHSLITSRTSGRAGSINLMAVTLAPPYL